MMFIRRLVTLGMLGVLGALSVGTTTAGADTTVVTDTPGGGFHQSPAGDTMRPTNGGPAVITLSGLGSVTCANATFDADVTTPAGTPAIAALTALTFTSCTDTIPVLTFTGCHLDGASPTLSMTASGTTGGSVLFVSTYLRCAASGSTSGCYFLINGGPGTWTNAPSSIAFSGVAITHSIPAGTTGDLGALCGPSGTLSVSFGHVVNSLGHTLTIRDP
jgi:hypothetical protein